MMKIIIGIGAALAAIGGVVTFILRRRAGKAVC